MQTLLPLLAATALTGVWAAASPVLRHVLRETFTHPRQTSVIERDRRTGEVRSYVLQDGDDRMVGR